ncbi:CYTH domain-containing protein [Staphylococcus equorum]|uniref:CYTH domain-containing protein n=1 Tax=Staphylococcus equorum TaxID=246432 RepID=A0A9X4L9A3_9STAP|nr:CYTH domain-containing protein [Staphylococcus equorum]MDG0843255.1 CYTH domain-containing protein [Staphylococcus equorum]MDG0858858.1 CYTH domain-containing protein [Staphylococcus equorum]
MATNNEIEFKQLLSQSQYQSIYNKYFLDMQPFSQTNYYIDTEQFDLRSHNSALRIRVKDKFYEMTLKVPAEVGLMEYNFETHVIPELNKALAASDLPLEITQQLNKMNVDVNQLVILGALTTSRLEKEIQGNLLVLDRSDYLNYQDYELEYEVEDYDEGLIQFKMILETFDIKHETPENKVQRFFNRKSNLNNN